MSFERQFLLASHALALLGVAALETTHQVGLAYVLLALVSLVWSGWRGSQRPELELSESATNFAMLIALGISLFPVLLRGASPVRAIAEFLLVLLALKSLAVKANRDWLQIFVLSFFQLVAAAALTVELIFAVLFLTYLLLAPCVLVLFLLRREISDAGGGRRLIEEPFVEPSLFRSIATVTVVLFLSTFFVFMIFPRMGAGYFAPPLATGLALTGFSEEVGLGGVAALKQDDAVAMRVTVDKPEELFDTARYWRGVALDRFDGRRWTRMPRETRVLLRPEPNLFVSGNPGRHGPVVEEDVILEPQDSAVLFFAGRPLEIRGKFSQIATDALGNLRVMSRAGVRERYQVTASLGPRLGRPTPETLTLPSVDPRIVALAREQVAGFQTEESRAGALLTYLRRGFRYTLEPGDPGQSDPLVRFLFETKSGHCEYFASAYAVMLRAVGIPSVVVNGYAGGEWNPYGGYFVISQSDAHSWVEAYLDGQWRTLDPTPAAGTGGGNRVPGGFGAMVDAYRMRWYRYVVNYSLEDQAEAALSLRDNSGRLWRELSGDFWKRWRFGSEERNEASPGTRRSSGWMASAVFVAALGFWFWRRRRARGRSAGEDAWPTRCYLSLLRLLERRGLSKRPAETPNEFFRRIEPRLDGQMDNVRRITALYQEARFSGRSSEAAAIRSEIDALLADLARLP